MASSRSYKRAGVVAGTVAALALTGAGAAIGSSDDDSSDKAISGSALKKAEAAALAETGEGEVTGTEVGDEESYYEVEVTLDDGSHVDVQLDRDFRVVGTEREGSDDQD